MFTVCDYIHKPSRVANFGIFRFRKCGLLWSTITVAAKDASFAGTRHGN